MNFISKLREWFGGKKEETPSVTSEYQQKREDFSRIFQAQEEGMSYEEKSEKTRAIISQGREAIAQTARSNVTELVPKAEQERRKLAETVMAYLKREDSPLEKILKEATGVEAVDNDYYMRIRHELLTRPEAFHDMTCFALEDYLHAVHTSMDEVHPKAQAILTKAYQEMTGVPKEEVAAAEEEELVIGVA